MHGGGLVAHVDQLQARAERRIEQRHDVVAGQRENGGQPRRIERAGDDVGASDLWCHGASGGTVEYQQGSILTLLEIRNLAQTASPETLDQVGWTIADPQPDYLRRRAKHEAHVMKVAVLGDDGEAVVASMLPDKRIIPSPSRRHPPHGLSQERHRPAHETSLGERLASRSSLTAARRSSGAARARPQKRGKRECLPASDTGSPARLRPRSYPQPGN